MKLCEHHLYRYFDIYGFDSVKAKQDNPTETDPKDCEWREMTPCQYEGDEA